MENNSEAQKNNINYENKKNNEYVSVVDINVGTILSIVSHFEKDGLRAIYFYIPGVVPFLYCSFISLFYFTHSEYINIYIIFVQKFVTKFGNLLLSVRSIENAENIGNNIKLLICNSVVMCFIYTIIILSLSIIVFVILIFSKKYTNKSDKKISILFLFIIILFLFYFIFFDFDSSKNYLIYYDNFLSVVTVGTCCGLLNNCVVFFFIALTRSLKTGRSKKAARTFQKERI